MNTQYPNLTFQSMLEYFSTSITMWYNLTTNTTMYYKNTQYPNLTFQSIQTKITKITMIEKITTFTVKMTKLFTLNII